MMDGWTSPNHHAYIAFGIHFDNSGSLQSILLDIVEVARVRLIYLCNGTDDNWIAVPHRGGTCKCFCLGSRRV